MEAVYSQGISLAEALQERTMSHEKFWLTVTYLGDPNAAFFLIFPFTYFISKRTGVAVLWVAAISEWLNLVFKWMLFGERPFWWIGESGLYVNKQPKVQQFPSTCETGPGSPSGHAMVTAAVWWAVVSSLGSFLYSRTPRYVTFNVFSFLFFKESLNLSLNLLIYASSVVLSSAPYLLYVLMLVAVGISRVFILAHFPHQVVAGSITGIILGIILSRRVPAGRPLLFFFSVSIGLLLSALSIHAGLQQLGFDLSW
ncbi:glucose-6-phosphatase 3 [Solea senegalensis]|uniref:Glucose-6-phosphatase 3 n=1 Tax=Solea senegalensis TaxID=28829 RepID=A0AAV6RRX3_SOLSE|nr:glucose-6-phosphatase 3 [Solea senegalensis]